LDELAESYGHLRQAAGHMAGGAAEKVTPPYDRARNMASKSWVGTKGAFQPMVEQMRAGAANARADYEAEHAKRNRWPALVGLLAAGAAVGAAGAMVVRRRRAAAEWEEYEPIPAMGEGAYGEHGAGRSAVEKVSAGAASVAETVSSQAGKLAESLQSRSKSSAGGPSSGSSSSESPSSESSAPGSASGPSSSAPSAGTSPTPAATSATPKSATDKPKQP